MKLLLASFAILLMTNGLLAEEPETFTSAQLEHFEKQIRPILIEQCYSCHQGEKIKGGLRLDSRAAILNGGDSGPAVIVGKPNESELIKAINYDADGYQMPPKGKLQPEQINLLTAWVQDGLPWPKESAKDAASVDPKVAWKKRSEHWSLKPLHNSAFDIPKIEGQHQSWPSQPIDHFILEKLISKQLSPAPLASRRILIRRLKFDLLGLPPTPEEIIQFELDSSPNAYEQLVDRFLASPHYGERYGRHWLDLMRFAESAGHEFDFTIDETWRYRDYVIKAFNEDVPYNQFVTEHLAGDLLSNPRLDPITQLNESILGTGFLWMSQGKHSPVDIKSEECDLIDNQIDVMTKSFLATSVACARCHDHKFDAITANDYYALSGYLKSACRDYVDLNTQPLIEQIRELREKELAFFKSIILDKIVTSLNQEKLPPTEFLDQLTRELGSENNAWLNQNKNHPLHLYNELKQLASKNGFPQAAKIIYDKYSHSQKTFDSCNIVASRSRGNGQAFSSLKQHVITHQEHDYELLEPNCLHSCNIPQLVGTARTTTFKIEQPYLYIKANKKSGIAYQQHPRFSKFVKTGQVHIVIEGFQHIRDPIYGSLTHNIKESASAQWYKIDVSKWVGCRAYIEVEDLDAGWIRIDDIKASSHPVNPAESFCFDSLQPLLDQSVTTIDEFAARLSSDIYLSFNRFISGEVISTYETDLVNAILKLKSTHQKLAELTTHYESIGENTFKNITVQLSQLLNNIKPPVFGLTTCELSPWDDHILIRGNPNKPGEIEPRRFLSALENTSEYQLKIDQQYASGLFHENQSQRHELAFKITHRNNPLFARVMVNRIWKHHFGQGLVSTLDDFGHMGQPPTHPELLDYLANWFIEHDYSIKLLSRMLVTSKTYQQSSDLSAKIHEIDPQNLLYHRMNLRRLDAEIIRDALIHVTEDINTELYGPSIPVYLTSHMQGRGRPDKSGPLNGAYKRSIYTEVRRNFITPFFLAFDYPLPMTTTGKRSISNVPAQSLAMKNNPLVHMQSKHLAEMILSQTHSPETKLEELTLRLFARSPSVIEQQVLLDFVKQSQTDPQTSWTNLCHLLFNMKEFIYVP